jgi:hypothetical protein
VGRHCIEDEHPVLCAGAVGSGCPEAVRSTIRTNIDGARRIVCKNAAHRSPRTAGHRRHRGRERTGMRFGRKNGQQRALRQQAALRLFLDDGRLSMTNNASERALRSIAVGRKAWLFFGSDDHAQAAANLFSLIASCLLHGLDPESYLADVFRVMPYWPRDRYCHRRRWRVPESPGSPVPRCPPVGWGTVLRLDRVLSEGASGLGARERRRSGVRFGSPVRGTVRLWAADCESPFRPERSVRNARSVVRR